jgi:hypothetical protein
LAKVKAVAGDTLRIALDYFISQQLSVEAMGPEGGKVFVVTLKPLLSGTTFVFNVRRHTS